MQIALFTDFGTSDIYLGQVKSVLHRIAPEAMVIDLANDLPPFNVRAAAHLLDALKSTVPTDTTFLCVVDPGVGTARDAVLLDAAGRRFVGPDNGLLSVVAARAPSAKLWRITWRPDRLSDSFHGRDLFAPVAARIAAGALPTDQIRPLDRLSVNLGEDDLEEAIYVDHYGNVCTGIRASSVSRRARLIANDRVIGYARVFAEAQPGELFWCENSHGLVEIAANRASAAALLGVGPGQRVGWEETP